MKHIKKYNLFESEHYTEQDIETHTKNSVLFIDFLTRFIVKIGGYSYMDMDNTSSKVFYIPNDNYFAFYIHIDNEYFVLKGFNGANNILINSLPEYLKTIDGIVFNQHIEDEYEYYIPGNLDSIIKQISIKDLEIYSNSKKYNL